MSQTALTVTPKGANICLVSIEQGNGSQLSKILSDKGYKTEISAYNSVQVSDGSLLIMDSLIVSASATFSPDKLAEDIIDSGILSR